MSTESPQWFKSSYSSNGGVCIEIATNLATSHGIIPVRDSKNPNGPRLAVETTTWTSFVDAIRDGQLTD